MFKSSRGIKKIVTSPCGQKTRGTLLIIFFTIYFKIVVAMFEPNVF